MSRKGHRNFGALLTVFALSALMVTAFCVGARWNEREEMIARIEGRVAAADGPERAVLMLEIRDQKFCAPVSHAQINGHVLTLHAKNTCVKELSGMDWLYQLLDAKDTVLFEGKASQRDSGCASPRFVGDVAICVITEVPDYKMAVKARVWTVPYAN